MKKKILTKNDVYQIILERINNGSFTIGTKLPPCRTLAKEIQSNISTAVSYTHLTLPTTPYV